MIKKVEGLFQRFHRHNQLSPTVKVLKMIKKVKGPFQRSYTFNQLRPIMISRNYGSF